MYAWERSRRGDLRLCAARILAVLAEQPPLRSMKRLDIQKAVFGSQFVGSYDVPEALRWLREHDLVTKNSYGYRVTERGRTWSDSAPAFATGDLA